MIVTSKQKLIDNLNKQNFLLLTNNKTSLNFVNDPSLSYNQAFKQSWNNLKVDPYLEKGKQFRLRRYSVLLWSQKNINILAHENHYQSKFYNHIYGGVNREFSPINNSILNNPFMKNIIHWNIDLFNRKNEQSWRIQCHQFRILATADQAGQPTPEGIHQDGADYVFIMLMNRHNISGGISSIYNKNKKLLSSTTLKEEGESILVNDRKLLHGVTDIKLKCKDEEGYRDVLVLSFHKIKTM